MFGFGSNKFGQVGVAGLISETLESPTCIYTPRKVGKVKDISLGKHHSAFLDYSGNIFTWGNNYEGQLGHIV